MLLCGTDRVVNGSFPQNFMTMNPPRGCCTYALLTRSFSSSLSCSVSDDVKIAYWRQVCILSKCHPGYSCKIEANPAELLCRERQISILIRVDPYTASMQQLPHLGIEWKYWYGMVMHGMESKRRPERCELACIANFSETFRKVNVDTRKKSWHSLIVKTGAS